MHSIPRQNAWISIHSTRLPLSLHLSLIDMTLSAVELQGVSKRFGNTKRFIRWIFTYPRDPFTDSSGPRLGKTTTMRMILRIYRPDTGTVRVLGGEHGDGAGRSGRISARRKRAISTDDSRKRYCDISLASRGCVVRTPVSHSG